jgi:tetrahydromethanopterin S-methyltransferase subunit G
VSTARTSNLDFEMLEMLEMLEEIERRVEVVDGATARRLR